MITDETLRKVEQARDLLTEVREDLKGHLKTIPATADGADPLLSEKREQVARQQDAVAAVNAALRVISLALAEVRGIWEQLSSPVAQKPSRITWRAGRFADHRGTVGGVEAFAIHWHTRREDPNYFLNSILPGVRLDDKSDDLDFLKAKADEVLAAWLARMGGAS